MPRTRCATSPASWSATGRRSAPRGRRCRSSARARPGSTTTVSPGSTRSCGRVWSSTGCPDAGGALPAVATRRSTGLVEHPAARPRALPRRHRRRRARLPPHDAASRSSVPGGTSSCPRRRSTAAGRGRSPRRPLALEPLDRARAGQARHRRSREQLARAGLRPRASYQGEEQVYVVRGTEIRTPLRRTTLSGSSIPRVALPRIVDDGETVRFLRSENLPGYFPFTAGVFPFKRTRRGTGPHVRRRGRPGPHQPAVPPAQRGPARDAALHGVRLGHALRPRPVAAPGHLRQGRHVRVSRSRRSTTCATSTPVSTSAPRRRRCR